MSSGTPMRAMNHPEEIIQAFFDAAHHIETPDEDEETEGFARDVELTEIFNEREHKHRLPRA